MYNDNYYVVKADAPGI